MTMAEIRDEAQASRSHGMSLSVRTDRETSVVSLGGNVDLENSPAARALLLCCVDENREVVVDLRGIYYMDSSGVGSLVEALVRAKHRGRRFSLVSAHPATLRALRLARLDEVFTVHETLEGAAQARRAAVS